MTSLLYPSTLDPLPLYTPRQGAGTCGSETSSIKSSAPSYTSDVPSYHSTPLTGVPSWPKERQSIETAVPRPSSSSVTPATTDRQKPTGLPRLEYAPGFRRLPTKQISDQDSFPPDAIDELSVDHFNLPTTQNHFCNDHGVHQRPSSTEYTAIAGLRALALTLSPGKQHARRKRPISHSACQLESPLPPLSPPIPLFSPAQSHTDPSSSSSQMSMLAYPETSNPPEDSPLLPQEDPLLVGSEAAAQARSRRLYMHGIKQGLTDEEIETLRSHEAKTWDHLMAQMKEWEERDRRRKGKKRYGESAGGSVCGRSRRGRCLR